MNKSDKFDGLMYFAQRMQESTFYYTIDIYKAPLLNTNQLVREYIRVSNDLPQDKKTHNHLEEIRKEFLYSIEHDVILKEYWGIDNISLIKNKIHTQSSAAIVKTMHYLASIWDNCVYYNWCLDYIKKAVRNPLEKKKIELIIRCLLPEIYAYGYSNEYIYKCLKKHLFDKRSSFSNLDDFLSSFSLEKKEYTVYLALSKDVEPFRSLLYENLGICFVDDGNFSKLRHEEEYLVVCVNNIKARDEYNAFKSAKRKLDIFILFYMALDNKKEIGLSKTAMTKCGGVFEYIPTTKTIMNPIEKYDSAKVGEMAIEKIFGLVNHNDSMIEILSKIFEKHNTAIMDSTIENGFLNLWSILEIFSSCIDVGSKIEKIRNSVLVIIINNYFKRIIIDLAKNLKIVLKNDKFSSILEKVTEDGNELLKLSCLVLFEQYDCVRTELNSELSKSPNLRSRISQLNQLGGNSKNLYSLLNKYKERVSWHLARMYRCRNAIIHSGESVYQITSLIEHLHSYIDIIIDECVANLSDEMNLTTIDDIIMFNQLREDKLNKMINVDKKIDVEMLNFLLK